MKRSYLYMAVAATFCASLFLSLRGVHAQNTVKQASADRFSAAPMFPGVRSSSAVPLILDGATNGVIGPPNMAVMTPSFPQSLQGASCGPLGPQPGVDASVIVGVDTSGFPRSAGRKPQTVAVLVVNIIAASAIIFALSRKISHMWVLATVVASVTALSGFACALVSGI